MSDNSKKIIVIMIFFILIVVGIPLLLYLRSENRVNTPVRKPAENKPVQIEESENTDPFGLEASIESSRALGRLPIGEEKVGFDFNEDVESLNIEYLSFADFYKEVNSDYSFAMNRYELPLNVRTDLINYYDVSRRFNLDPHLSNLSTQGFSIAENNLKAQDFYGIYEELFQERIPVYISSDFIIYYYQQKINKIFKNVEANVFYKNLWDINLKLFEQARRRYESRLSMTGNVNDRVLEAERLAAAYFATSLELLKPKTGQVASSGDLSNENLFTFFEGDIYDFNLPEYLRVDVLREVALINTKSRPQAKSPVLLYARDYNDFIVPPEYVGNAKLNNFYLATKWLSSTFPVHYRGETCLNCKLEFDDWRIAMISAALISNDLFNNHDLKNDWARIYKTLAFFKGLRGDLSYVDYRDALVAAFGEDYVISDLFADENVDNINNLYRFQDEILKNDFLEIEGAFDKDDPNEKALVGVKMLSDFYWPNSYIYDQLSYPYVREYLRGEIPENNITACSIENANFRCKGFFLDIVSLFYKHNLSDKEDYIENTAYTNYFSSLNKLRSYINQFPSIWHYNNYWQNIRIIEKYLNYSDEDRQVFMQNDTWRHKELETAKAAWVNFQLAPDEFVINQKFQMNVLEADNMESVRYIYLEPNIDLVNEQLASVRMIYEMFSILKITEELRSVFIDLEDLRDKLETLRALMIKELEGDDLDIEDLISISMFSREYSVSSPASKRLIVEGANDAALKYDISNLDLAIIISQREGNNYLSIGPVFSPLEN